MTGALNKKAPDYALDGLDPSPDVEPVEHMTTGQLRMHLQAERLRRLRILNDMSEAGLVPMQQVVDGEAARVGNLGRALSTIVPRLQRRFPELDAEIASYAQDLVDDARNAFVSAGRSTPELAAALAPDEKPRDSTAADAADDWLD